MARSRRRRVVTSVVAVAAAAVCLVLSITGSSPQINTTAVSTPSAATTITADSTSTVVTSSPVMLTSTACKLINLAEARSLTGSPVQVTYAQQNKTSTCTYSFNTAQTFTTMKINIWSESYASYYTGFTADVTTLATKRLQQEPHYRYAYIVPIDAAQVGIVGITGSAFIEHTPKYGHYVLFMNTHGVTVAITYEHYVQAPAPNTWMLVSDLTDLEFQQALLAQAQVAAANISAIK